MENKSDEEIKLKRNDSNKIYRIHPSEFGYIAKEKVHKKYEFGCKVSFLVCNE